MSIVKMAEFIVGKGINALAIWTQPICCSFAVSGWDSLSIAATSVFSGNINREMIVDTLVVALNSILGKPK